MNKIALCLFVCCLSAACTQVKTINSTAPENGAASLTTVEDEPKTDDVDAPFTSVDSQPSPKGGMGAFYKYVQQEMKYPEDARKEKIMGKVFVQFIVEPDGSLSGAEVIKGVYKSLDDEAVRIIENSPPWSPGILGGKPVRVRMVLPITFKLG